jgi:hypothetical protein
VTQASNPDFRETVRESFARQGLLITPGTELVEVTPLDKLTIFIYI